MSSEMEKKRKTSTKKTTSGEASASVKHAVQGNGKALKAAAAKPNNVKQWPTHEQIAMLAHRYYEERGWQDGFHEQDWYRAERELMPAS